MMMKWRNWNWKLWLAVPVFLAGGFFGGWQLYQAFWSGPPKGFYIKTRTSPALDRGSRADLMWNRFRYLYTEAQREAAAYQQSLASFSFLELGRDPQQAVEWSLDTVINPGFDPLRNIERTLGNQADALVGYYTSDGQALAYTLKRPADFPNRTAVTIHLDKPINPGQTTQLLRLQRRKLSLKPNKNAYTLSLGWLPDPQRGIHARGVRLPERARVVKYAPDQAFTATNGVPMVGWINTYLPTKNRTITVTFTLPQ